MTGDNKKLTERNIEAMRAQERTNLWHGIQKGIDLFDEVDTGRVPAVMILTDGLPNYMCDSSMHAQAIHVWLTWLSGVPLKGISRKYAANTKPSLQPFIRSGSAM